MVSHKKILLFIAACWLALFAIYWPGLHGGFFFDDGPSILLADGVHISSLSIESLRQALSSGQSGPTGRPIAQLSFALNYYFSDFSPFAFKITNLAIHCANGLLVFWLTTLLLIPVFGENQRRNAFFASGLIMALWLLHPMQLLPVLHVVQRMTSLSAFFLLLAMILHILGRTSTTRSGHVVLILGWCVCWPMAFLSKETAILFPLLVLSWETILHRQTPGQPDRTSRTFSISIIAVLLLLLALTFTPFMNWVWSGYTLRPFTPEERLLTETRVLWFYIGQLLLPRLEMLGLYHDDIPLSTGLLSPWNTIPSIIGLALLLLLIWKLRKSYAIVSFGIAWFLVGHLLESTVLPLEIAHEHRNYLPSFGILFALIFILLKFYQKGSAFKTLSITLLAGTLVYNSFVTTIRSQHFADEGRRTQLESSHHPNSSRAQFDAGAYLASKPGSLSPNLPAYSFARVHFERSIKLDANSKIGFLGLISLNCIAGLEPTRDWIDSLAQQLNKKPFAPADQNILFSLKEIAISGKTCLVKSDMDYLFSSAIENRTVSPSVRAILYSWLADYLVLQEKDIQAAKQALEQSLRLVPRNPSNRLKWAQLLLLSGEPQKAKDVLQELLRASPPEFEKKAALKLLTCLGNDHTQCKPP